MIYVLFVVILRKLLCLSYRFIFLVPFPSPCITKHNTTIKPYQNQGVTYVLQCRSIILETQIHRQSNICRRCFQVPTIISIIIINIRRRLRCVLKRRSAAARLLGSRVRILLRAWMFVFCACFVSCRQRPLRRADHLYREVLSAVVAPQKKIQTINKYGSLTFIKICLYTIILPLFCMDVKLGR